MFYFSLNLVFTLFWLVLSGNYQFTNMLMGYSIAYGFLWIVSPFLPETNYFKKIPRIFGFFLFYLYELVKANMLVAWDVIDPRDLSSPAIVGIPLDITSEFQIALLMNLITFTPGSLSLYVTEDHKTLYVHGMFVKDKDVFRAELKNGFERRVKELFE